MLMRHAFSTGPCLLDHFLPKEKKLKGEEI